MDSTVTICGMNTVKEIHMKFFKKHFVAIITLVASIIGGIVVNCVSSITLFENLLFSILILLVTTFIFDFDKMFDKIQEKQEDFALHMNPSSIRDYQSVDVCAKMVDALMGGGKHKVDFVSLDTQIRTQVKDTRRPMVELLNKFVSDKNIQLRYLTAINSKNFTTILNCMYMSKCAKRDSYYAMCDSNVPFASFYIIDKKYLVIRTPYDTSIEKHYCIIEDVTMVLLFQCWFEMLWKNAEIIDTQRELKSLLSGMNDLDENEKGDICKLIDKVVASDRR